MDPIITKLVARAAIQAMLDEEKRNRMILIMMIPIIIFFFILTMFVYILSTPFSFFITKFVATDEEKMAIEQFRTEYQNVARLDKGEMTLNGKYPMPTEGNITSPFGERVHPITGELSMHAGIDIGSAWHSPIKSITNGQVVKIGIDKGYGNFVLIKHELPEETFYSFYAHLSKIYARPDQEIFQGDIIGLEGGDPVIDPFPGLSTGHHLHFEIRTSEDPRSHIDPMPYLYRPKNNKEDQNA